ncbi:hypothetical protein DMA12_45265 [Amycolatopsis balhimycina DSM 5908]|uniref:DUF6879 domain-containing protein n=1 Tax=Amycolatopsis balhimycina DSM 5908 TaxID=1081091 RepID=A0A428VWH9_AMYBA|nr:DUF6879 family protein [Amycolatopsis balhimycina]RSM35204.1 hypothetical protein DMA12_45265 [Amycolatopsis balhimycina DSM 5908]
MLDIQQLGNYIDEHYTRTLFRLETLPQYLVDSDGEDYRRYVTGLPGPTMSRKQPWLDTLRAERDRGLYQHRVHVWRSPLTDYLRYECEWGYAYNAEAGEEIRVIDTAEQTKPAAVIDEDFWLINDTHVAKMHYDPDGRFLGSTIAEPPEIQQYRAARDAAWAAAVPFVDYWNRHREYWRSTHAM